VRQESWNERLALVLEILGLRENKVERGIETAKFDFEPLQRRNQYEKLLEIEVHAACFDRGNSSSSFDRLGS